MIGQISQKTWQSAIAQNKIACQAQGSVWFSDPHDLTGSGAGSCVPPDVASKPDFDSSQLFSSFTWCVSPPCTGNAPASQPKPRTYPKPLPPEVINGPVPDITARTPAISEAPPPPCGEAFAQWVDQNKPVAAIGLLVAFWLMGGLK